MAGILFPTKLLSLLFRRRQEMKEKEILECAILLNNRFVYFKELADQQKEAFVIRTLEFRKSKRFH